MNPAVLHVVLVDLDRGTDAVERGDREPVGETHCAVDWPPEQIRGAEIPLHVLGNVRWDPRAAEVQELGQLIMQGVNVCV